jgi:hypothetical protein
MNREIEELSLSFDDKVFNMTSGAKDILSKEFRQTEPNFPLDVTNLIYDFLPAHKLADDIVEDKMDELEKKNFSLRWLDKEVLKGYHKEVLKIVEKYFTKGYDEFLLDYCSKNVESYEAFKCELDGLSPLPSTHNYMGNYLKILLEMKYDRKLTYPEIFFKEIDDFLSFYMVAKLENIMSQKFHGSGGYVEDGHFRAYFFYPGTETKTLPEVTEYFFLSHSS